MANDIKCFVELTNGQRVVLYGSVTNNSPSAVHEKFKQIGYEMDGVVHSVKILLECRPLREMFQSKDGQQQDASQPR